MKKHNNVIIIFAALFFSTIVNAQEGYLCISEAAGGVSFEQSRKKWEGTVFKDGNEKILISKKENRWTMKKFNNSLETDCTSPNEYGVMSCRNFFGQFNFNTKTRRYLLTYLAGYIDGVDNNDNTPYIQIGVCTKL